MTKVFKKCQFIAFFSICNNIKTALCKYNELQLALLSNYAPKPVTAFVISSRSIFTLLTFVGLEAS